MYLRGTFLQVFIALPQEHRTRKHCSGRFGSFNTPIHVKIMKHDCFSRCTTCVSCSSIIETGTPAQRAEAERTRQYHWDRVTTERRNVNDALYKSLHEEENFFFCEIDGMDSAKTILPHFHQFDKDVLKDRCLKIHITCVKYNGARPDDVYYFTDAFPHDSGNTITVMYGTLLKVRISSLTLE